ncbi:MAG: hypothetical protein ACREXK_03190 [Gammaproteobacteria bacterium]
MALAQTTAVRPVLTGLDGPQAQAKTQGVVRTARGYALRQAERALLALTLQEPPRTARFARFQVDRHPGTG